MSEHTENVKIETSTPQTAAPAAGAAPSKTEASKAEEHDHVGRADRCSLR